MGRVAAGRVPKNDDNRGRSGALIANVIGWEATMSQLFGPVQQLGYVVSDIESAIRHWTQNLHIGPFYYVDRLTISGLHYQGEPRLPQVSVALTYSGNLQIELIQQRDDTPSSYLGYARGGKEGLHHIGFFTEHFDRDLQRAAEAGLQVEQSAVAGDPAGKSAYFATSSASSSHAGTVLKLIDLQSSNCDLYRMVRTEAERWDGSGPVRRIDL